MANPRGDWTFTFLLIMYFTDGTNREYCGEILTFVPYSSYGLWNNLTDRTNRTVPKNYLRIVNEIFKSSLWLSAASKVQTVRTENGFTDRSNRTVRETDLWIMNKVFQSVKESVCD